jgi:triosephosphate isomerase
MPLSLATLGASASRFCPFAFASINFCTSSYIGVEIAPGEALKASKKGQTVCLGAQNMHWEKCGTFTGEISATMLRALHVKYAVLGHSERRTLFDEIDEVVNRKIRTALEAALHPIFCVGESLQERDDNRVRKS